MKALIGDAFILSGIGFCTAGVWMTFGMSWGFTALGAALVVTGISVVRSA